MKALLAKLNIDDSPKDSPESSGSIAESITASSAGMSSMHQDFEGPTFYQGPFTGQLSFDSPSTESATGGSGLTQNTNEDVGYWTRHSGHR